jgi:hypothetical protein
MLSLENVITLAIGMRHSGIGFEMIKTGRSLEVGMLLLMRMLCIKMIIVQSQQV